jgi:hypothetical protein
MRFDFAIIWFIADMRDWVDDSFILNWGDFYSIFWDDDSNH